MVLLASLLAAVLLPVALLWVLPLVSDVASLLVRPRRFARGDSRLGREGEPGRRQRLLVLVPAHDEALLIGDCARSLVTMERRLADSDVVILADNCTDDTAALARAAGARALERHDLERRGKPYAIEWALTQLPVAEYDAVVIVDADTTVVPEFADALSARGPLRDKGVQAYFGSSNQEDSWLTRLAALLEKMRYEGQYPLKRAAGLNCALTGNGMCLGTGLLARAGWAQPDQLTEDFELYARYTALGETIDYARAARLHSQETKSLNQASTQRRRWQAGKRAVLRAYVGRLLNSRKIGWRQKLDALAELSFPGPVLHATLSGLFAVALFLLPGAFPHAVATLFALSVLPTVLWTAVTLVRQPDRGELLMALARLPFYAVWRVLQGVLAISTGRRKAWTRSPRHAP